VAAKQRWGEPARNPAFWTFDREAIDGIVALDGRVVANLLVKTVERAVLDDIDGDVAVEDVDEIEGDDIADVQIAPVAKETGSGG